MNKKPKAIVLTLTNDHSIYPQSVQPGIEIINGDSPDGSDFPDGFVEWDVVEMSKMDDHVTHPTDKKKDDSF